MGDQSNLLYNIIINYGYIALFIGLVVEGTGVPGPVEILFLAAGYLISQGQMNLLNVIAVAASGNVVGNTIAYIIGYYKGRPFVQKYGKYMKITVHDLENMDRWFSRYGGFTNFISRIIGLPRTPAIWASGITRMNFNSFFIFSAIADLIWSAFWAYVSYLAANKLLNINFFNKSYPIWVYLATTIGFIIFMYFVWRLFLWMKEKYIT